MMTRRCGWLPVVASLMLNLMPPAISRADKQPARTARRLTDQEKRGKQIYLNGVSSAGRKIAARFGDPPVEVMASALKCVNCHGHDGEGRPEGGVTPSNITWASLTRPYNVKTATGRVFPAYNDRAIIKAVTAGFDSGGNRLATTMPRYRLTHKEAADLVAYVKCLGEVPDTGLTDDRVTLGVLLPHTPAAKADAVRSVLDAWFGDLNKRGGLFNRQFELRFATAGESPAAAAKAVESLIRKEQVFAVCGAFIDGAEAAVTEAARREQVPVIGAVTDYPELGFPLNRHVFYLLSGTRQMARAMADFMARSYAPEQIGVVHPKTDTAAAVAKAMAEQFKKRNAAAALASDYDSASFRADAIVSRLSSRQIKACCFLGTADEQAKFLAACRRQDFEPDLFVPGPLVSSQLFGAERTGKTYVTFARGPRDQTAQAVKTFREFAARHKLPVHHLAAQVQTYCAAMVLVEGFKRAGRDINRSKLTFALEGLYEFRTGLTPEITFGPNRRVGAQGAYIATIDEQELVPVSHWISVK